MALGSRHAPIVGSAFEVADDRRPILERLILGTPQDQLMAPDLVAIFVKEYASEWNRGLAERSAGRDVCSRELEKVERKLAGLIDAIADGFRAKGTARPTG